MKESILVSACLMGLNCRYDGKANLLDKIEELKKNYQVIPICPEILGGLPTPREPAERHGKRVINKSGEDVTQAFNQGAKEVLKLVEFYDCKKALLKQKSPSCGSGKIYDGNFKRVIIKGNGVLTDLLLENGVQVYGEEELQNLL